MSLIQPIAGEAYSTVDDRCLTHPGCVIDLGCLNWDWCKFFLGKKRVIGADPFEKPIAGAELFQGVVAPFTGTVEMTVDHQAATGFTGIQALTSPKFTGVKQIAPALSWQAFCERFKIDSISVLKMNIEGAEYPLLASLRACDFAKIDQIVVSFHDWMVPEWRGNTAAMLSLLSRQGFNVQVTGAHLGWHLASKERT